MNIFNSLGSNYNFQFVIKSLFSGNDISVVAKLKSYLESRYQGKVILLYKGREAIELALNLLKLSQNTAVAINGFTCFAVYDAITRAGCKIDYIDITKSDLNFSAEAFKNKLKENSRIKVLIIQNTLGYPCDIEKIAKICQQNKIVLIEDLAHSIGTKYGSGKEAGTLGDFVILSFSQDKIIDGVSGGALIIRNKKYHQPKKLNFFQLNNHQQTIDRLYPLLTYLVRVTYQIGIGKIIHWWLKKFKLLSNPMMSYGSRLLFLPPWYCSRILLQFEKLADNLRHRRQIASIYAANINSKILSQTIVEAIPFSTSLRFPVFVNNRSGLISYLKKYGLYVSDIWYDAPIAPRKYQHLTDYQHQCPEAEKISAEILNLPTHQYVSSQSAQEIAERINQWLKLP